MKTRGSWVAILAFWISLPAGAAAQQTGNTLVAPDKASVKAEPSQKLFPFQDFKFLLQLYPAPHGYGQGKIFVTFKNEGAPPSSVQYSNQRSPTLFGPPKATDDLHDDQSIYNLALNISEHMSPGKWKLAELSLSLGSFTQKTIPVAEDVSFVVAEPQSVTAHVQAPSDVEGGKKYTFTVMLDRYPADVSLHCKLELSLRFRQGSTEVSPDPPGADMVPGQLSYEFSHKFEPDFPSGLWEAVAEDKAYNSVDSDEGCWYPQLQGEVRVPFNVEPARNLVTPTSAVVTVNPSQVELLRGEADRLRAKEHSLRDQLTSENPSVRTGVLETVLQDALADVDRTKARFISFQKDMAPDVLKEADIFFDDIKRTYALAQETVAKATAGKPRGEPSPVQVRYALRSGSPGTDRGFEAVLESIAHNEAAYDAVADAESVAFDLDVRTVPEGAAVSYGRRGDSSFTPLQDPTNSVIKGLSYAIWEVRFVKEGYEPLLKVHNPFTDKNHVLAVELTTENKKSANHH